MSIGYTNPMFSTILYFFSKTTTSFTPPTFFFFFWNLHISYLDDFIYFDFDWLAGHSLHNSSLYKVFLTKRMRDFSHRMFESQLIVETNWANISNSSACSAPCGCPVTAKERRRDTDLKWNVFIQPGLTKWPWDHFALFCVFTGLNYRGHLFWTGRVLCG